MPFIEQHFDKLMILALFALVLVTLIILVPQLLRVQQRKVEIQHLEHMRSLEQGLPLPPVDEGTRLIGRATMLVPMVVFIAAGTVTCFLAAYSSDSLFSVSLAVWAVAGIVSLATIVGGVTFLGNLAYLKSDKELGEVEGEPTNPSAK